MKNLLVTCAIAVLCMTVAINAASVDLVYNPADISLSGNGQWDSSTNWNSGTDFGKWAVAQGDDMHTFSFDLTDYGYTIGETINSVSLKFQLDPATLDTTGGATATFMGYEYDTGDIVKHAAYANINNAATATTSNLPMAANTHYTNHGVFHASDADWADALETTGILHCAIIADAGTFTFQSATLTIDSANIVPEPTTIALLGLGGLAMLRKKRKA